MAVRSKHLWGPTTVGTNNALLYTSPAGETTLLKCLTLVNLAVVTNTVLFRLNGTGSGTQLMLVTLGGSSGAIERDLFIVMQPGDTLHAAGTQATCTISGFGAQLEGVAD